MKSIHIPRFDNPYLDLMAEGLARHGVEVEFRRGVPSPLQIWRMRRERPIVHLHWLHFLYRQAEPLAPLYYIYFCLRIRMMLALGFPIVWTMHNLMPHETKWVTLARAGRRLMQRHAAAILVHCHHGESQFRQTFGTGGRFHVIPQGSYVERRIPRMDRAEARQLLNLPAESFIYLFFGLIRPYKGIDELVDAFVTNGDPDAHLIIAGDTLDETARAHARALAAKSTRIILHDRFVPDEELPRYFGAANVAVSPFRKILNSSTVLMSMTMERAVIAPRMGCIPEIVPDSAAILYDPDDANGLAKALKEIRTRNSDEMGRHGRAAAEALSWDKTAGAIAALYREVSGRA